MGDLLEVRDLSKHYGTRYGSVRAVDGISFSVKRGEIVALVGESGCGKSTVALSIIGLTEPSTGHVSFDGQEIALNSSQDSAWRRHLSIVFQNPYSSLNPRMRVVDIVGEPLKLTERLSRQDFRQRVTKHLHEVGLNETHLDRYPHQFSGGQRQRIAIARAMALRPKLLILDEPTAALDVSVQAQVLNLLREIQMEHQLSYLFISHNLATVECICDRVLVMYLGRIVEEGTVEQVFHQPQHPYTKALLASVPQIGEAGSMKAEVSGEPPSPLDRRDGCAFANRCSRVSDVCRRTIPALAPHGGGQNVACFHPLWGD